LGRVVKGARFREERYALEVPEIAPPPAEQSEAGDLESPGYDYGFGGAPEALIPDLPLGHVPEPAVDVEAIRAQAQEMLDEASRSVDRLLAEAHDRARTLVEDAAARADAIAQDARKRGHEEGFHAGREAADRDMNDMLATMRGLLEMANVERHKLMLEAEPELVKLALGIAERVLHQQVALDRGVVVEMARSRSPA